MANELVGQWGTATLRVPDYLEDARDAVNDFAEYLVAGLEVLNVVLEFVKAFIRGYLDPLIALIQLIIDEIMAILRDLRQIGIYMTGDWALLGWPPKDLEGGFAGYQKRMIARMTDRTDPTRPEVSSATKVIGFFGYLSVDTSEFEKLIRFIIAILKLFGQSFWPDTSRLPIPQIQETLYGLDAVGVSTAFQFQSIANSFKAAGSPPSQCRVTWVTLPAAQNGPFNPFPVLGPSGYIVTVSTAQNPISLKYSRPISNTGKKPVDGSDKQAQPRESGTVLDIDSRPVLLYGGAEMLSFNENVFGYNTAYDADGILVDAACQVFGFVDPASNEVIPLEDLGSSVSLGIPGDGQGDNFVLQRTFIIQSNVAMAQWFAGEYSTVLSLDDMPQAAHWEQGIGGEMKLVKDGKATHYYVRVHSVTANVAKSEVAPQWDFKDTKIAVPNAYRSGQPFVIDMASGNGSLGMPSPARRITFANANTKDYLHALETAILVLVLSRADLPLLSDIIASKTEAVAQAMSEGKWPSENFANLATGLEESKPLIGMLFPRDGMLERPNQDPITWRNNLFAAIRQLAADIYEKTGPMPDAEKAVVDATEDLRTVTWEKMFESTNTTVFLGIKENQRAIGVADSPPIFTSLDPENPVSKMTNFGVCPNIMSMGFSSEYADRLFFLEDAFQLRGATAAAPGGEFATRDTGGPEIVYEESDPAKVILLKLDSQRVISQFYNQFTDNDGALLVPENFRQSLRNLVGQSRHESSGDATPVFVSGASTLMSGDASSGEVVYSLRGLLRNYGGSDNNPGIIYQQAAIALRVAASAFTRAPQDGEWIALRLFDAIPDLETFLRMLENWVLALAEAIQSMADAIIKYIEFIQGIIASLQQLILKINALIQGLLSFAYTLPQFSGLMLTSNGTDALMADFVAAENKPSDSPLAYGGGIALVIPFGPQFIFDLISLLAGDPDPNAMTSVAAAPDPIGIEQIEPGVAPSSDEPDVL